MCVNMDFIDALADKKHEHRPHPSTPTGAPVNGLTMGETSARDYSSSDTKKTRQKSIGNQALAFMLTELHLSCLALPFHFSYENKLHISLPYFSLLLGQSGKLAPYLWYAPHSAFLRVFLQETAVIALHIHYLEHCLGKDLPGDKEKIMRFSCSSRTE